MKFVYKEKIGDRRVIHIFGIKISYKKKKNDKKFNVTGCNNCININEKKIPFNNVLLSQANIIVKGDNNQINIINYDDGVFTSDWDIKIYGNDNYVEIRYPINTKGKNTIYITGNNNKFFIDKSIYGVQDMMIAIHEGAEVNIGKDVGINEGFYCVASNDYETKHKIIIGEDVHFARNVTVRTSDGHTIIDCITKEALNEPKDVIIGNHVWICANSTILKGSQVADGSIVAAGSLVTKKYEETNILLGGSPAKIIKRNVTWDYRTYGQYRCDENKDITGQDARKVLSWGKKHSLRKAFGKFDSRKDKKVA